MGRPSRRWSSEIREPARDPGQAGARAMPATRAGRAGNGAAREEVAQKSASKFDALEAHRSREAHDLRACRRAGGRLGRVRLDRHSGRPDGARTRSRPSSASPTSSTAASSARSHGLQMIAKRIETNRARLDNPNKPIGVFMLCGPSGVGKTETALALAEALYGGEQNMITINMSEFQEAHTVSTLKGAPPGYVGYGEGGRLTEAVRPQALQRHPARRGREGASRRARDLLPGVRQGHDGGRHRPADRLQEHADHPDHQCRHRRDHGAVARPALSRRSGGARRSSCGRSCSRCSRRRCSAASSRSRTSRCRTKCSAASSGCSSAASPSASRRTTTPSFVYDDAVVDHIVSMCNDPGFGRAHDRQHHHQHAAAGAVARIPQAARWPRRRSRRRR